MKIYEEKALSNFVFWSGAIDRTKYLTISDFNIIENQLEELYPEGMTETEINDLFWFDENYIAEMLGYNDFEELINDRKGAFFIIL